MEGSRVGISVEVVDQQHNEEKDGSCECHINKAEIQKGAWNEDRSECISNCKTQFLQSISPGWSEAASGWADVCGNLNSTSKGVEVAEYRFWSLYWCDSAFCGVAIDQSKGLGQDPNVDSIITTCDNNGFKPIIDPGPPHEDFKCSTEGDGAGSCTDSSFSRLQLTSSVTWESSALLPTAASATAVGVGLGSVSTVQGTTSVLQESDFSRPPLANTFMAPESQQTEAVPPLPTTTPTTAEIFTFTAETKSTSSDPTKLPPMNGLETSFPVPSFPASTFAVSSISSLTTSTLLTTTSTSSTSSATHPAASKTSTSTSAPVASATAAENGLSNPAKIAIAVCATIALLMLICALFLCLRKRKRGGESSPPHRSLRSRLGLNNGKWGGGNNPTPLISPASSLMGTTASNQGITPPLRLRQRKFIPSLLPSILRPGGGARSGSPPLTPLTPQHSTGGVFPSSPICTPTTSKLVPRHERTPGGYTGGLPPIPAPVPMFVKDCGRGSGSAASSMTAATTNNFFGGGGVGGVFEKSPSSSSPARPKRPHDGPLEIPDLLVGGGGGGGGGSSTGSLVSPPLSPPPTRALPATPPVGTTRAGGNGNGNHWSVVSSSSSNYSSEAGNGGRVKGMGLGGTLYHHQRGSAGVGKERGSWGSWSGTTAQQQGTGTIGKAIGSVRDKDRVGKGEEVSPRSSSSSSGSSDTVTGGTVKGGTTGGRGNVGSLGEGGRI
ncbi:hypothetical protein QC762_306180 [Podospora pseudocomata]|uniref:Uncharacterized protein n=1 Tax=Podospora pseudocomata TaxID=2093779 RepID=A0ABR0GJE1_9PEZI|nr:hypothetical protein QC762_306180 [Podospora pseudocomata]